MSSLPPAPDRKRLHLSSKAPQMTICGAFCLQQGTSFVNIQGNETPFILRALPTCFSSITAERYYIAQTEGCYQRIEILP
jgi:hypothetical protein